MPSLKSCCSELFAPDDIRDFVFYCCPQIRARMIDIPLVAIFPQPYEYFLDHIHTNFFIPGNIKCRLIHFFPIPAIKDCKCSLITPRSEEHTSELQSRGHLVCRLLLEKK